ncbi:MAG TPA: glycosyltransferase [Gaiellaceae bacterium]|nr:glycosyltransferase [Gaiellaceae bacterium]
MVATIFWWLSFAIFVYFVVYVVVTFALIVMSLWQALLVKVERGETFAPPRRLRRPGISLVAPAYNMAPIIVGCVRSFLSVDYEPFEVVIVDDGSTDDTIGALVAAFDLTEIPVGDRLAIPTATITDIYVSRSDPRLRVVRKENGGRSDAVNAGLNVAYKELVALTDGDTMLEKDALKRIGEVFAADPDGVVAVGGTVRIANGSVIENYAVTKPRVARPGVEASQTAEYLRGFLGGRVAWSTMNGLLILSGAFGVFRRDLLRDSGGLSKQTLGEDMELTLRLHHQLRPQRPQTRIVYAADANAWTEIPPRLAPLRGQRIRWHAGLIDNLRIHRRMICRRRFGAAGTLALPYTILFELLGPLLQLAGYLILVVLVVEHRVNWPAAVALFVITLLVGQLQTAGALLIEEVAFHRYLVRDLMLLAGWSLAELFWFRPLTALWRVWATVLVLFDQRPGWGSIPRGSAFQEQPEVEIAPAPLPR